MSPGAEEGRSLVAGTADLLPGRPLIDCISRVENRLGIQPSTPPTPCPHGDTAGPPNGNFGVTKSPLEATKKTEGGNQAHESRVATYGSWRLRDSGFSTGPSWVCVTRGFRSGCVNGQHVHHMGGDGPTLPGPGPTLSRTPRSKKKMDNSTLLG